MSRTRGVAEIRSDLTLYSEQFQAAMKSARRQMRQIETQSRHTSVAVRNMQKRVDGAANSLKLAAQMAKGYVASLGVHEVIRYTDAWKGFQNQLRLVTNSQTELNSISEKMFLLAQRTRSSMSATASLYKELTLSTAQLNLTESERIRITETINKAMKTGGGTAEAQAAAVFQLNQALASGVLRGQEFNSISEQAPAILRALQDSLGKTRGELRAMAAEGQLTTEVIAQVLLEQSDVIDKSFGKLVVTFGEKLTLARNEITKFVGASALINKGADLAGDAIVGLASNMDTLIKIGQAAALLYVARLAPAVVGYTTALAFNIQQQVAYQAALARGAVANGVMTRSQIVLTGATATLNKALLLVGGPAGAIVMAMGAAFLYRDELGRLIAKTGVLGEAQKQHGQVNDYVRQTQEALTTASEESVKQIKRETNELLYLKREKLAVAKANLTLAESEYWAAVDNQDQLDPETGTWFAESKFSKAKRNFDLLKGDIAELEQLMVRVEKGGGTVGLTPEFKPIDAPDVKKLINEATGKVGKVDTAGALLQEISLNSIADKFDQRIARAEAESASLIQKLDKLKADGEISAAEYDTAKMQETTRLSRELGQIEADREASTQNHNNNLLNISQKRLEQEETDLKAREAAKDALLKQYGVARINLVTNEFERDRQLALSRYNEQVSELRSALEQKAIVQAEYDDMALVAAREFEAKKTEIAAAEAEKQRQIVESKMGQFSGLYSAVAKAQDKLNLETTAGVVSALSDQFGAIASHSKRAFELQKRMQMATAMMSAANALLALWGDPTIKSTFAKVGLTGMIAGITGAQIAIIESQQYSGQAHKGMEATPVDGSYNLSKGERVIQPAQNVELGKAIEKINSGHGVTVNLIEDSSRAGQVNKREENQREVIDVYVADLIGDDRSKTRLAMDSRRMAV